MKSMRPVALAVLALGWLSLTLPAQAGLFDGNPPGDFLPVEEAFVPGALQDDDTVLINWQIADGYYLYKHALNFELPANSDATLGQAKIPDGEKHVDEFFGEVETYRNQLTVELPVESGAPPATIEVRYQGCADAGLCYPPQTSVLTLAGDGAQASAVANADTSPQPFVAEQDRLADLLANGNLIWTLISFLGLGLLLAFTPCILPMIPILSGIIVGRGDQISAGRGFALSCAYVLAMALAYTVFGVLAGLFGGNLQAALQSPWVLAPFAGIFVALALAMFGLYQLQMPSALQTRINNIGQRSGGGLAGAAIMGFLSALVVGPCLAPPLAGALLYIGNTGNAALGGAALFSLGVGMGLPLIILGTVGGSALPRAGAWMNEIKILFGIILLGVALWLLSRIVPGPVILALWAALLAGYGVHLNALDKASSQPGARLAKAAGVLMLVYAVILLVGASMGGNNPLQPLAALQSSTIQNDSRAAPSETFERVGNLDELQTALARAADENRPAIVDFYADWCVECVHMERTVFSTAEVQQALQPVAALQVDVTDYDAEDRAILKTMGVIGPPTILFFAANGAERKNHRLIGEVNVDEFIRHLRRALNPRRTPLTN